MIVVGTLVGGASRPHQYKRCLEGGPVLARLPALCGGGDGGRSYEGCADPGQGHLLHVMVQ